MEKRKRVGTRGQHKIGERAGTGGASGLPHRHRDHLRTFLSIPSCPTSQSLEQTERCRCGQKSEVRTVNSGSQEQSISQPGWCTLSPNVINLEESSHLRNFHSVSSGQHPLHHSHWGAPCLDTAGESARSFGGTPVYTCNSITLRSWEQSRPGAP